MWNLRAPSRNMTLHRNQSSFSNVIHAASLRTVRRPPFCTDYVCFQRKYQTPPEQLKCEPYVRPNLCSYSCGAYSTINHQSFGVRTHAVNVLDMEIWKFLFSWFCLLCTVSVSGQTGRGSEPCNFPAIYNFGDSNSDTGGLSAAFLPVAPPNGESFFGKPAGRACDGHLVIDFIGNHLSIS